MKYQVVKGCVIKGEGHQPGSIVELDELLARQLMGIGRVVPQDDAEPVIKKIAEIVKRGRYR